MSTITKTQLVQLYRSAIALGVPVSHVDERLAQKMTQFQAAAAVDRDQATIRTEAIAKQTPRTLKLVAWVMPLLFLGVGLFMLGTAVLPIFSYLLHTGPQLQASQLLAPIPPDQILDVTPQVVTLSSPAESISPVMTGPKILDMELDYSNLANWFHDPLTENITQASEDYYLLDIPALEVEQAKVFLGGTNLNKGLIQYPGTAEPGQPGAPVIFGHSVLRQFYNPSLKNSRRYMSIFSYIMTLKPGDEIILTKDGVKYTYVVREKTEVKPEDTFILAQNHSARLVKLVTCVPEGTYLRRGVVTAELLR